MAPKKIKTEKCLIKNVKEIFKTNLNKEKDKCLKNDWMKFSEFNLKSQTLEFLIPSQRCKIKQNTVFFENNYIYRPNFPRKLYKTKKITIKEPSKYIAIADKLPGSMNEPYIRELFKNNSIIITPEASLANNIFIFYLGTVRSYITLLKNLYMQQIVNNVAGTPLGYKNYQYANFKKLQDKFPKDFKFMKKTFLIPDDNKKITKYFENYKPKKGNLWLYKKSGGLKGLGTFFITNSSSIPHNPGLLCHYIDEPFTVNKKKHDIRVHVLYLTDPFRVYVHKNGFIRLSVDNYTLDINNLNKKLHVHLSCGLNNKETGRYVYNPNYNIEYGNLWTIKVYREHLRKKGINDTEVFERINDAIIKFIIGYLENDRDWIKKKHLNQSKHYKFLGFDIMLDKDFNPYILECNGAADREWEYHGRVVSEQTFKDELNLIGIRSFDRNKLIRGTYNDKGVYFDPVEEALCESDRPTGGFNRVFPRKDNIKYYRQFFKPTKNDLRYWKSIETGKYDDEQNLY